MEPVSNPTENVGYSLDCFIKELSGNVMPYMYSRIAYQMVITAITFGVFIALYVCMRKVMFKRLPSGMRDRRLEFKYACATTMCFVFYNSQPAFC